MERHEGNTAGTAAAGIGGVGLAVRDLGRTAAFYRDVIGLDVVERGEASVLLGVGADGFLELSHEPDALADDPREAGLFHTAFLLPARGDLADWLDRAVERRIALDGASDHSVSEAVYLSDPEGNGIEVYADRPRDTWRWQDGQVVMGTVKLDGPALLAERSVAGWQGAPAGTRIGHVHLRVGDAAEAQGFYRDRLALDLMRGTPQAAFLSWNGYHHHVAANTWQSQGAGRRNPRRAGLRHVTFAGRGDGAALHDPWGTELRFAGARTPGQGH